MARLDAEERLALLPLEDRRLSPSEIVAYLRSLPALWADSGPDGRQALVSSIFARTDVLGFQRLEYDLTPDAIDLGLDAALPRVLELEGQIGEFGRGERSSGHTIQLSVRIEPPSVANVLNVTNASEIA